MKQRIPKTGLQHDSKAFKTPSFSEALASLVTLVMEGSGILKEMLWGPRAASSE